MSLAVRPREHRPARLPGARLGAGVACALLLLLAPLCTAAETGGLSPPGSPAQRAIDPDCLSCWVQQVTAEPALGAARVPPSNPACYGQPSLDFFRTALAVVAPRTPATASGDLAEAIRRLDPLMAAALSEGSGAAFRTLLREPAGRVPFANCAPLAALLPAGARIAAVTVSVDDGRAIHNCDPVGGACGDGGRFVQPPALFDAGGRAAIAAVFMEAGPGDGREGGPRAARLTIAFRMPAGSTPLPLR